MNKGPRHSVTFGIATCSTSSIRESSLNTYLAYTIPFSVQSKGQVSV